MKKYIGWFIFIGILVAIAILPMMIMEPPEPWWDEQSFSGFKYRVECINNVVYYIGAAWDTMAPGFNPDGTLRTCDESN